MLENNMRATTRLEWTVLLIYRDYQANWNFLRLGGLNPRMRRARLALQRLTPLAIYLKLFSYIIFQSRNSTGTEQTARMLG